jgi:hypothetical protein
MALTAFLMTATSTLLQCGPGLRLYLRGDPLRPLDETPVEPPVVPALPVVADEKHRLPISIEPEQDPVLVPGAPDTQLLEVRDGAPFESVSMWSSERWPFMREQIRAAQDRLPCPLVLPVEPIRKIQRH